MRRNKRRSSAASPGSALSSAPRLKRPRRSAAARGGAAYKNADEGTLQFVDCPPYFPLSAQPFEVTVSASAALVVDLHAHFTKHEIIGYLAGTWDPATRLLRIVRAFPGVSTSCDHDGQNAFQEAEMDPIAEVTLREEVRQAGLTIVGWYHSHPTFEPTPSSVDVTNQGNYQILFRDECSGQSPFIGMICGPYDTTMTRRASKLFYFFVDELKSRQAKRLKVGYTGLHEGLVEGGEKRSEMGSSASGKSTNLDRCGDSVGSGSSDSSKGSQNSCTRKSSQSSSTGAGQDSGAGEVPKGQVNLTNDARTTSSSSGATTSGAEIVESLRSELGCLDPLFAQLKSLILHEQGRPNNLDLSTSWRRETSHLDATLASLRHRLAKWAEADIVDMFCKKIGALLEEHFCK